ncbi:MAG TPA: SDR family NAD(P)-dependent oxidoreductase [bacterium]|nr:SDR family NAD(P)-dependent oxidoreductase [bacterium]
MLDGKVAIITGAGRGIGRGMALLLASKGAKVVVNDIGTSTEGQGQDVGPAQEVVDEIKKAGGQAIANTNSVTTFEGATGMVQQALKEFGGLHIVVNNAGILRDRMLHKMAPEDWQAVMEVHLNGHYNVTRAAINHFREQEWGRVINFTSTSGIIGNLGQANYGAAKLGIFGFTRIVALETMRYENITCNAISPFAYTRMTASIPVKDEKAKERVERTKKMRAEDIAPVVAYLCSDGAKHVTGQIFGVRAGEIMVFSQPRPLRSVHHHGGWTPELVGEVAMPALAPFFDEPKASAAIFPYDPLD